MAKGFCTSEPADSIRPNSHLREDKRWANVSSKSFDELMCFDHPLDQYISSAKSHGEASVSGDHKKANDSYDRIIASFKKLKAIGRSDRLLGLLSHDDANVRLWAATHSLEWDEGEAIRTLRALAASDEFASFSAQVILEQWDKGEFVKPE